jgi:hypothetical protein
VFVWLKRILLSLALVLFGVAAAILIIEIGLRIVPAATWKGLISKTPVRHVLFQTDRKIGWVHVPLAQTIWQGTGEYEVEVKINSLGLRDYERPYQKPPGTFRILALGDSLTEGLQVPLEQTFTARLEKCLAGQVNQPVEVINAGVSAYGPGDELLFFTQTGLNYDPDLVLTALYIGNDFEDMIRDIDGNMIQSFGGYQFYLKEGRLEKAWLDWTDPDETVPPLERFLRRTSKLYYLINAPDSTVREQLEEWAEDWWPEADVAPAPAAPPRDLPDYAYDEDIIIFTKNFPENRLVSPPVKTMWALFQASLQQLQAEVAAQQIPLAAVIIPAGPQIHSALYEALVSKKEKQHKGLAGVEWDVSAPDKAISRFLAHQNIPGLDLLADFQDYAQTHPDLLYFPKDGHFNSLGHQITAELTCQWLVENDLLNLSSGQAQK